MAPRPPRLVRRRRIQLELTNLNYAFDGFAGGGEEQVIAENSAYRYIVYSGAYRTNYGPDGHNDEQFEVGLLVQRAGRIISTQLCTDPDPHFDVRLLERLHKANPIMHPVHVKPVLYESQ